MGSTAAQVISRIESAIEALVPASALRTSSRDKYVATHDLDGSRGDRTFTVLPLTTPGPAGRNIGSTDPFIVELVVGIRYQVSPGWVGRALTDAEQVFATLRNIADGATIRTCSVQPADFAESTNGEAQIAGWRLVVEYGPPPIGA